MVGTFSIQMKIQRWWCAKNQCHTIHVARGRRLSTEAGRLKSS